MYMYCIHQKLNCFSSSPPLILTNSQILSALSSSNPFSSTISFLTWMEDYRLEIKISLFLTSSQGLLSNLSTLDQMVLNMSAFTPQTSNMPSKIILQSSFNIFPRLQDKVANLWFTFTTNLPTLTPDKISWTIFTHSASGIMASYCPAMSKSRKHWSFSIYELVWAKCMQS